MWNDKLLTDMGDMGLRKCVKEASEHEKHLSDRVVGLLIAN